MVGNLVGTIGKRKRKTQVRKFDGEYINVSWISLLFEGDMVGPVHERKRKTKLRDVETENSCISS